MGALLGLNFRVHPKYKRKKRSFRAYRVNNGSEYVKALVQRGEITCWVSEDAIEDGQVAS